MWTYRPLGELVEPTNLNELVGEDLQRFNGFLNGHSNRVSMVYRRLASVYNNAIPAIEAAERALVEAGDALDELTAIVNDESKPYVWLTDTFNDTTFVDSKSTGLVDTDYGYVSLPPVELTPVPFDLSIDSRETKGIPGTRGKVLEVLTPGSSDKEPQIRVDDEDSHDLGNLVDSDVSSRFEVERCFVAPKQKVIRLGRAYRASAAGQEQDVATLTKRYDWNVVVEWPDRTDYGPDEKGIPWVELENIDPTSPDKRARMVLRLKFPTPQTLSCLKLAPFIEEGQAAPMRVDAITAYSGELEIPLATEELLTTTQESSSRMAKEVLRRTGTQAVGGIYWVPTDRPVDEILVSLSADPAPAEIPHEFLDVKRHRRSERRYLVFSSVDHRTWWERMPLSTDVRRLIVNQVKRPNLLGTVGEQLLATLVNLGLSRDPGSQSKPKDPLGQLAASLSSAVPGLSLALTVADVIKQGFGFQRDISVEEERKGWDLFSGWRASVALREISTTRVRYASEAIVDSVKLEFAKPVQRIGLIVTEEIPSGWGAGDWLSYWISTDGQSWTPLPKLTDVSLDDAYDPGGPVTAVYFRIVLKGNPDDPWRSPRVRVRTLQGL